MSPHSFHESMPSHKPLYRSNTMTLPLWVSHLRDWRPSGGRSRPPVPITSSRQHRTIRGRMQGLVDNRYRVVGFLGAGGMADVYLVHDDLLERDVALKVLRRPYADDEDFVKRFKREAQYAAALSHPYIVSFYGRGETEDGTHYIAMEYVPGGSLKARISQEGSLAPGAAATVTLQVAEALRFVHQHGLVHRDIKPPQCTADRSGSRQGGRLRHSEGLLRRCRNQDKLRSRHGAVAGVRAFKNVGTEVFSTHYPVDNDLWIGAGNIPARPDYTPFSL